MTLKKTQSRQGAIRLYYFPGTRAARARWLLEELSLGYELQLIDLRTGAHKRDDYLAVHPLGKVPALEIDGTVLIESLAICLYLADRHWQLSLAPVPEESALRGDYLKWMAFSTGTLEPAILEQSRQEKARKQDLEMVDMGPALTSFESAARYVEETLANQPFLLGQDFSAADIMNGSLMMWANGMELLDRFEHTRNWIERLKQRPAYRLSVAN